MGLFSNKQEREAKRAQRERERDAVRAQISAHLDEAMAAATRHDIESEERSISRATGIAQKNSSVFGWNAQKELQAMVESLTAQGRIRRSSPIGFAGSTFIWEDRILVTDEPLSDGTPLVRAVDKDTRAEVMTEGELRTTKRPTLTRMAVGSVLPGTALIPGFAFQKKESVDDRRVFFTIEQRDWGKIIELDPAKVDVVEMRQVAMNLNAAAGRAATVKLGAQDVDSVKSQALEDLRKLGELREGGSHRSRVRGQEGKAP